jgi:hypothetical protein
VLFHLSGGQTAVAGARRASGALTLMPAGPLLAVALLGSEQLKLAATTDQAWAQTAIPVPALRSWDAWHSYPVPCSGSKTPHRILALGLPLGTLQRLPAWNKNTGKKALKSCNAEAVLTLRDNVLLALNAAGGCSSWRRS